VATIFIEGFDKYGAPDTLSSKTQYAVAQGGWSLDDPTDTNIVIRPGLAGLGGGAVSLGPTNAFRWMASGKFLNNNYGRLLGGIRFVTDGLGYTGFLFYDSPKVQCFILVDPTTGLISFNLGGTSGINGTTIASSFAAVTTGTEHML
jgi:hypothetical protein